MTETTTIAEPKTEATPPPPPPEPAVAPPPVTPPAYTPAPPMPAETPRRELPHSGSPDALIGLLGIVSLAGGFAVLVARRRTT
jgi:LPXTG-motif cell wall-anchored protein